MRPKTTKKKHSYTISHTVKSGSGKILFIPKGIIYDGIYGPATIMLPSEKVLKDNRKSHA